MAAWTHGGTDDPVLVELEVVVVVGAVDVEAVVVGTDAGDEVEVVCVVVVCGWDEAVDVTVTVCAAAPQPARLSTVAATMESWANRMCCPLLVPSVSASLLASSPRVAKDARATCNAAPRGR